MPVRRRGRRNAARVGEVVGQDAEGSQRWELLQHAGRLHLEQALRFREVLELVEPEIVEANLLKEALPTAATVASDRRTCPPCAAAEIRAVWWMVSDTYCVRQASPARCAHRPAPEWGGRTGEVLPDRTLPSTHAHRGSGVSERDQERVPLRSQLEAVPRGERSTQQPVVLLEQSRVGVTEASEQARRALDVREDEGDDARRQP